MTLITPEMIDTIRRNTPAEYVRMHEMNVDRLSGPVRGCKLWTVFTYNGDYYVYVGVNGRNRKYPLIAVRVHDRSRRKMTVDIFDKVRKASSEEVT